MTDLGGRVAVVTGAGSGIGLGIAEALAEAGMRVAVCDIDAARAEDAAARLRAAGATVLAAVADVSRRDEVEQLARRVETDFGPVWLACNNAGVFCGGPLFEATEDDWKWLLSVNLMGVVHGCHVFGPLLRERGEGHIVNTASIGGLLPYSEMAAYCTTKAAVLFFSDCLRQELEPCGVGVSVLCPGVVRTRLDEADRLRPPQASKAGGTSAVLRGELDKGMDPLAVGRAVVDGVRKRQPYIFTHPQFRDIVAARFAQIVSAFD